MVIPSIQMHPFGIIAPTLSPQLVNLVLRDEPVGLGEIVFFTSKGTERCAVVNLDVSHIVGGHTEYKSKLVRLLGALQVEPA